MALAVAETVLGAVGDSTALSAAHRTLSDLASEFPNDPVVAHRFAGVLIYEGRLSEAEAQLVRAISIDPDNRNILLTLEYVYEALGNDAALAAVRNRIEDLSGE
jgi:predicted Zn-dependent protease